MVTAEDLRYIAGVLDARASCSISKSGGSRGGRATATVSCNGLSDPVREYLASLVGGHDAYKDFEMKTRVNCIEHCTEPHVHYSWTRSQEWRCTGFQALVLLENVRPYMKGWDERFQRVVDNERPHAHLAKRKTVSRMASAGWEMP